MAKSLNKNLQKAKTGKNDEFYMQLSDIKIPNPDEIVIHQLKGDGLDKAGPLLGMPMGKSAHADNNWITMSI